MILSSLRLKTIDCVPFFSTFVTQRKVSVFVFWKTSWIGEIIIKGFFFLAVRHMCNDFLCELCSCSTHVNRKGIRLNVCCDVTLRDSTQICEIYSSKYIVVQFYDCKILEVLKTTENKRQKTIREHASYDARWCNFLLSLYIYEYISRYQGWVNVHVSWWLMENQISFWSI